MTDSAGPGRKPRVSDDDLLAVFTNADDPVLTATEIAEKVPIGKRAVLKRLAILDEQDAVESKHVGARARVWWSTTAAPSGGTDPVADDIDELARAAVDELGKSWSDDALAVRVDALAAAYQYLRDQESASKSDFTDNVYPEHSAGYGTPDGAWWRSLIRPGLEEMPHTVKPSGGGKWQYVRS